jgi:hypothetical protein
MCCSGALDCGGTGGGVVTEIQRTWREDEKMVIQKTEGIKEKEK